jgi:hypothetical protein
VQRLGARAVAAELELPVSQAMRKREGACATQDLCERSEKRAFFGLTAQCRIRRANDLHRVRRQQRAIVAVFPERSDSG